MLKVPKITFASAQQKQIKLRFSFISEMTSLDIKKYNQLILEVINIRKNLSVN